MARSDQLKREVLNLKTQVVELIRIEHTFFDFLNSFFFFDSALERNFAGGCICIGRTFIKDDISSLSDED
jgi:hypothetical protein